LLLKTKYQYDIIFSQIGGIIVIFKEFKEFLALKKRDLQLFDIDKLYMAELKHYLIRKDLKSFDGFLSKYEMQVKGKTIRNLVVVESTSDEKSKFLKDYSSDVRKNMKDLQFYKAITMGDRVMPFMSMDSALKQTEFNGDMYALDKVLPFRNLIKARKINLGNDVNIEIPSVITLDDIKDAETYLNQDAPTLN